MPKLWTNCHHLHVSGVPCGVKIPVHLSYCLKHSRDECRDCTSMMEVFKPPKGWDHDR